MTLLRKHAFKYKYTMQIETNNVKVTDDLASVLQNTIRLCAICEHLMDLNRCRQYFDFDTPYEDSVLTFSFEFIMSGIEHIMNTDSFQFMNNIMADSEEGQKLYSPSQSRDKIMEIFEKVKVYNEMIELNLKMIIVGQF